MAEIINLRAVKKARSKTEARAQADANAAKFGRTKAERNLEQARANKARQTIDAHKRCLENPSAAAPDSGQSE
jgi:hypothetical protein